MSKFLSENGIVHEVKCVYTPQQNDIAKRKNSNLLNMTQTLLFQTKEFCETLAKVMIVEMKTLEHIVHGRSFHFLKRSRKFVANWYNAIKVSYNGETQRLQAQLVAKVYT